VRPAPAASSPLPAAFFGGESLPPPLRVGVLSRSRRIRRPEVVHRAKIGLVGNLNGDVDTSRTEKEELDNHSFEPCW
jgi:hypothetical protein